MQRQGLVFAIVVVVGATMLGSTAAAAVAPGTYKGNLYAAGKKIAGSPATVVVSGSKVTIKAPKFTVKCQDATGQFTQPQGMPYEFKGTLKGNAVSGTYASPLGGTGELFIAKGTFTPATKSFSGTLSFSGKCKGTSAVKATAG